MIYECVILTIALFLFVLKGNHLYDGTNVFAKRESILRQPFFGILIFIAFALLVFLFIPDSHTGLSFFILKSNTGTRVSSIETNSFIVLVREIVLIGIYSIFILLAVILCKKSLQTSSRIYLLIAIFLAMIITMIIVSEARSSQFYCGFACLMLLSTLFPSYKKQIFVGLGSTVVIVVLLLSVYKTFYAFKYGSYASAIDSADVGFETITYNLEVYALGPLHYSSVIELEKSFSFGIDRLLYGFFRSIMGTNLLVKSIDMDTTSMVFNKYVSFNRMDTGYLLPITGLGYLYFKSVLSPVISVLVYYFALKMEKAMNNSSSAFGLFFIAYVYIRLATSIVCTNINTILSMGSMIAWSAGAIYVFNKLFTMRQQSRGAH